MGEDGGGGGRVVKRVCQKSFSLTSFVPSARVLFCPGKFATGIRAVTG